MWDQIYNPLGNTALSTIAAAVPVVTLLVLIARGKVKAHLAAIIVLITANIITTGIFTMPAGMSIRASKARSFATSSCIPSCWPALSARW